MITAPRTQLESNIKRKSVRSWLKGYVSDRDDNRQEEGALKTSVNTKLEQNGTIRPRPSLVPYGTQPTGTVLGWYEFVKVNSSTKLPETFIITVQDVAGTAKVYYNKDGGAWTRVDGVTFNSTAKVRFEQVGYYVLVMNGVGNYAFFKLADMSINALTTLSNPTTPTATVGAGLTGTTYNYFYKYTAANVNETAATASVKATTSKSRATWTGATEFVDVVLTRVTGATKYNIYLGTVSGYECYLGSIDDPGTGTTFNYRDDGKIATNVNRLAPNFNATSGNKCRRATNLDGLIYMLDDPDNPYRITYGAGPVDPLNFNPYAGGGWVELNPGGKEVPKTIKPFRDGKGTPAGTILSEGTNGGGKIHHIVIDSTTFGDTLITYAKIYEANGSDGTNAPDGVLMHKDSIWYPSIAGFKTTGTKAQVQGILSTDIITDNILPDTEALSLKTMPLCNGVEKSGTLYWGLAVGTATNNQIWTLDLKRGGAWLLPWNIAADNQLLYGDNSDGKTKHLVLSDNKVYELTYNQKTADDGVAFYTQIGSGLNKFSEDGREWGSVLDVTFIFSRPRGHIRVGVVGKSEEGLYSGGNEKTFNPDTVPVGWGEGAYGTYYFGETGLTMTEYAEPRGEITVEVDQELNWWQWEVSTDEAGVDYQLSDVIVRYVPIGTKEQE